MKKMKNNLIQYIFFFICLQSSVYGQYSIKTNLFAPLSRLPSMGITIERSIDSTKSLQFTFENSFTPTILNEPLYINFRSVKMESNFNPYFEISFFFTKRISFSAGYGYFQIRKKETLCEDPMLLVGTFIHECSDFITKEYIKNTQYVKIAPGFKLLKAGKRLIIDVNFKPSFVIAFNDNSIWDNENVLSLGQKIRPKIALFYNNNFFLKEISFYLIPKIELNVGYKL